MPNLKTYFKAIQDSGAVNKDIWINEIELKVQK